MILSPLNYVGNKARILKSLLPLFPQQITNFVDVFCGSGIVGLNAKSKNLILNDKETRIIDLLRYFQRNSLESILCVLTQRAITMCLWGKAIFQHFSKINARLL
ncbi:DNA adenine methylase [Helicobacter sp. 23-1048]